MIGAAAVALAVELRALSELAAWGPLSERVEGALAGLRGEEGISDREIDRLRRWARRWPLLAPELRTFYRLAAPTDERASRALWWVLDNRGGRPEPFRSYGLRDSYEQWTGRPTSLDLLPSIALR